uniref:Putative secreted effector protein CSEP054 n=1 Tax=Podosphaera xanthii TaxID=135283 RepID=A0A2U7N758_9PEZI|nr:putative secreted effector protein CSEP054 [Podosphaera xanthii]
MRLVTCLLSLSTACSAISISYSSGYDDQSRSLDMVSCSDGTNGLLTKSYTTQGSLPSFPRIGGASVIAGWNSESCGTCWTLTYGNQSVNVLAIDHAAEGFNVAQAVLDLLTNGHAVSFGRINGTATPTSSSACGL